MRDKTYVCPVALAGSLDTRIRRWLQNPKKILAPYIKEGMTVLDLGCGPGFFSIDMAQMVGPKGTVIAADLQEGMLQKVKEKIQGTALQERIHLHLCKQDDINISEKVDFVLAFYMVHEVPNKEKFFMQVRTALKPDGRFLIVEPKVVHVSYKAFKKTIQIAQKAGLKQLEPPRHLFNQSALFTVK